MIIVADSSALIALATCAALEILEKLYDEVYVPQAVYDEISQPDKPHANYLSKFFATRVLEVDKGQSVIAVGGLGAGELEAMALYQQLKAQHLLIDDRRARRVAEVNGIQCIGALGLLLLAKHNDVVTEVAPFVKTLRASPLHYTPELLQKVLELADEV